MSLPPFLQPHNLQISGSAEYHSAIFQHKSPFGCSHALWWPSKSLVPTTVVLFIPGNPGLIDFYIPFLNSLYTRDTTLAIFARSHVGQTAGIDDNNALPTSHDQSGLTAQVQTSIEAFDALHATFREGTRIVLIGHSIGGWLSLQVLKARSADVAGVFLLFPTLSHMRTTPNGQKLSWLFSAHMRTVISWLSYPARILPVSILALLFPTWPLRQILVLRTLLHSPSGILAALRMADNEMHTVQDLDTLVITEQRDKLWFYYAQHDDWVGDQKDHVLGSFKPELEETRVVHGSQNIPHSFCINHGEDVAIQCHQWLKDLALCC